MQIPVVVLLIALAAIGGYILGLLDSKFTNFLIGSVRKQEDKDTLLKIESASPGSYLVTVRGLPIKKMEDVDPETTMEIRLSMQQVGLQMGAPSSQPKATSAKKAKPQVVMGESPTQPLPPTIMPVKARVVSELPKTQRITKPKNLFEMITDDLQKRADAEGLNCVIKMEARPNDAIVYKVDGEVFEAPEKISDQRVRALVEKTLSEWKNN